MLKNIIGLGVVLLIVIGVGMYFTKSDTPYIKVEVAEAEIPPITLYLESGDVSFKSPTGGDFQKVTASSTPIENESIVKTGKDGHASVLLPDNSVISLDINTEITINYTSEKVSIFQSLGTTYHRVETLLTGSSYQVETPGTLAAVRGTKFAVKYDEKLKKTKVSVSEHKVQVRTVTSSSQTGTTTVSEEETTVEEGKTVSVDISRKAKDHKSALTTTETLKDKEMRVWIDVNKKEDAKLEEIKHQNFDKEEFRKEIRKNLFNDTLPEKKINEIKKNIDQENKLNGIERKVDIQENKLEDTSNIKRDVEKPAVIENPVIKKEVIVKPVINTVVTSPIVRPVVKKLDEDEFFDKFNNIFTNYFYLDEVDFACNIKVLPQERVRVVVSFGTENGYPFTNNSNLLSFAQAIDAYCKNKDAGMKVKLQARFDDDFPYNQ